ncbi:MAG: Rieske 2Fe-2S domain-containing protein [Dehalococcoidia bacterium]|nr:Rieske 2Fe-2S domain-containing protein [Dehalococcoidia bacterium]MCB9486866.1 Rieske 2Fe-2S domain-containing protein [Thermoflexaceae bacterium]
MTDETRWTTLGPADQIPPGAMKDFHPEGARSVLVVHCEGRFYAIEDRCTHDDGPLADGELVNGCQVECPRHGARFDPTDGRALTLPAIRPVASFPIRVSAEGVLEADLSVESPTPPRPRRGHRR